MPDGTPTSAPGQTPPQAPFGSTPATQPTPNRGHEAAAAQKLGVVVQSLHDVMPLAGSNPELSKAVMDAIKALSKFVPPGAVSPAGQKNQLEQMMMKNGQNNQQMQMLRQMQAKGGAQGSPQQAAAA
jgi:hypothetical protein